MTDTSAWGPLAALIGEWEGSEGLDIAFHTYVHAAGGEIAHTDRNTLRRVGPR